MKESRKIMLTGSLKYISALLLMIVSLIMLLDGCSKKKKDDEDLQPLYGPSKTELKVNNKK